MGNLRTFWVGLILRGIVALQSEVDPRLTLSVIRNLERIADHATNVAEDVLFLVKGIDVRHHNEERTAMAQN